MSVASLRSPLCWVIAHAPGNPYGNSKVDEWLRTATCVRDNLMKIEGQVDGFCGEAAYALAHLIDGTVVLGSYQFGGKPSEFENPHYWVEKKGYIIDPTAEQYGDFEGPIVTKTGDKHYVYTEDTFRDDPSEVRRLLKKGFIDPAISMGVIEELLKANCTAGIGLKKRKSAQGLVIEGWHSSPTGELGISDPEKSTEGVGYYVAIERETAEFFGRVVMPVSITLFNPLDARGEAAYILLEEDVVMEPPRPGDSEWLSAIKEAVSRSGTTDENWGRNQARLNQALTDVLQDRGYDGILIEDWAVKFASPEERAGLEGYLKSEIKNPDQARVTADNMSLTLIKEEKEDYDHFINDAARKIYVFLRVKRGQTHEDALGHLEEYAQWGEIPGVPSPLGRGEPVDNEIRALFGLPPIKGNPAHIRPEIEAMAMNNPFIHVDSADVKETFTYSDHPVAIVDVFEFGGMWNPVNRLIMFDSKTWGMLNEEEKRILLDHEIVEREFAMEDYAQYRSHSAAVEANHAKANAIISERYGAEVIDDLIARGLLANEAHSGNPRKPGKCQLYSGWHVSFDGRLGVSEAWKSTEGIGYYVGFDKETIGGWFTEGRVMTQEELAMCNPLDARGEPTYILNLYELDEQKSKEIFDPPRESDSLWLSAHKEAVKRSGATPDNWHREDILECLHQVLTDVLQEKGYDGVLISDWAVEFLSLRERLKQPGCKNRLNGVEFRK